MGVNYQLNKPINPFAIKLVDTIPKQLAMQLGSGFKIPLTYVNSQWLVSYGTQKVREDIVMAVMTPVGRRMVFPSFGSLIPYTPFEEYTTILNTQLTQTTLNAVNQWMGETVTNVSVAVDNTNINNNMIAIDIFYSIKGTNVNDSVKIILSNDPSFNLPPGDFELNGTFIFQV